MNREQTRAIDTGRTVDIINPNSTIGASNVTNGNYTKSESELEAQPPMGHSLTMSVSEWRHGRHRNVEKTVECDQILTDSPEALECKMLMAKLVRQRTSPPC